MGKYDEMVDSDRIYKLMGGTPQALPATNRHMWLNAQDGLTTDADGNVTEWTNQGIQPLIQVNAEEAIAALQKVREAMNAIMPPTVPSPIHTTDWQNDPLNLMPLFHSLGIEDLRDDPLDKAVEILESLASLAQDTGHRIGSWLYTAAERLDCARYL